MEVLSVVIIARLRPGVQSDKGDKLPRRPRNLMGKLVRALSVTRIRIYHDLKCTHAFPWQWIVQDINTLSLLPVECCMQSKLNQLWMKMWRHDRCTIALTGPGVASPGPTLDPQVRVRRRHAMLWETPSRGRQSVSTSHGGWCYIINSRALSFRCVCSINHAEWFAVYIILWVHEPCRFDACGHCQSLWLVGSLMVHYMIRHLIVIQRRFVCNHAVLCVLRVHHEDRQVVGTHDATQTHCVASRGWGERESL